MAKKKKEAVNRLDALSKAKESHQFDVGAGGSIYCDPEMSYVRGIRLPCLWMMELLGVTALRDSCSILVDGKPGSSKSSLALEMFNWIKPYGGSGAYFDAENKAAVDIAYGTLDDIHLWHPSNKVEFMSCSSIESVQIDVETLIHRCAAANKDVDRDYQIPFISVIDPISGVPSQEHLKAIDKAKGATDRGHGGRDEALLWSKWVKAHNIKILNLPYISVLVNHEKVKQEKVGLKQVERSYNPGGIAQNFAVTIGLRCKASAKQKISAAISGNTYQDIWINCSKNSRGPTGSSMCVRKYARKMPGGRTVFWWDWGRSTAEFLAGFGVQHESRDVIAVTKASDAKFSCKKLGLSNVEPAEIGDAIHADDKLMEEIIDCFMWRRVKEYVPLTEEEYTTLSTQAAKAKESFKKEHEGEDK